MRKKKELSPEKLAKLRAENAKFAQRIREQDDLFGLVHHNRALRNPYPSPTSGTTTTASPSENGFYKEPVYYDWGANWERVKALVPTDPVQKALEQSLHVACERYDRGNGHYYFLPYNKSHSVWPILYMLHRRLGNGEQDGLIRTFLPAHLVRCMNRSVAGWFQGLGERLIAKRGISLMDEEVQDTVWEMIYDDRSGQAVMGWIDKTCQDVLYNPNGPLKELLLACLPCSYAFMPLNYQLAKLLSPPDANLKVYASDEYSVIYDETHNIVFDNFWYFCEVTAEQALSKSKDLPQMDPQEFDFFLGGLVEG